MITIQELLYNRGLDRDAKTKLVRHKSTNRDIYNLYRTDKKAFLEYHCSQHKDIFKGVEYVVTFVGEEGVLSRFIGVYKVEGSKQVGEHFKYDMTEVNTFEDLKERVIMKWTNPISWHQWITNEMEVIEIQPGLHYKQFADYFDFILTFDELKEIVENKYPDWKKSLSITMGIYLISDTNTGKLYVGSAYGEEGIWGRWSEYVKTNGHGKNKALKELIDNESDYAKNFSFSILMLLPKTITPTEAINKETLYKKKLGTNSFGLNNN